MQLAPGDVVTIVCFALGLFGALIGVIYKINTSAVKELKDEVNKAQAKCDTDFRDVRAQHTEALARAFVRIEALEREMHRVEVTTLSRISDADSTISAFGGTYVSRNELTQLRDELNQAREERRR